MNIALIAMSGIRVCDTELLEMGLTLPGFVERSKTIASLPSLGLLTLAAMTPKRHHVTYLEVEDVRNVGALPAGFDLVAISTYSAQVSEAYTLASRFRDAGVQVVMGGPHVTACPEEALQYCDAVAAGEGEAVWFDIITDAEARRLTGLYDGRERGFDLALSPTPSYELLDITKYNRLTVQASRGCPHRCEFCASSVLITGGYKQKPVANVLQEIDCIQRIWERPFLEFADDNAMVNKAYWHELLAQMKNRNLRWFAETDISVADDNALLHSMREAGCAQLLIGLETTDDRALDGLEMRSNWKHGRLQGYKEAIQNIQAHGISVNGCFIVGLDGQTTDVFDAICTFVREAELYEVQITILTPFPGTPLYERLLAEDRMLAPVNWNRCTLFDLNFRPRNMRPDELVQGFKGLASWLYGEECTTWRRTQFRHGLRKLVRQ